MRERRAGLSARVGAAPGAAVRAHTLYVKADIECSGSTLHSVLLAAVFVDVYNKNK